MTVDFKPTPDAASLIQPAEIASVGVVGAGQMGNGIAHVCALAGLPVVLLGVKPEILQRAMAAMGPNVDPRVSRNVITADDKTATLARIATTTDYAAVGECDLVI